jgi:hypothetical protein
MTIYGYNIVNSPDDGGYYVEVCNGKTGKEVWTFPVYPDKSLALAALAAKYGRKKDRLIRIGDD